jgi:TIR domain
MAATADRSALIVAGGFVEIGDSLRRKIDHGLAHSTFGVVIMSKSFFAKGWPKYELDGIVGMSVSGEQRMLPIWHEISRDEIARQSPSLVDKIARNTAVNTVAEIADVVQDAYRTDPAHA